MMSITVIEVAKKNPSLSHECVNYTGKTPARQKGMDAFHITVDKSYHLVSIFLRDDGDKPY